MVPLSVLCVRVRVLKGDVAPNVFSGVRTLKGMRLGRGGVEGAVIAVEEGRLGAEVEVEREGPAAGIDVS